MTHLRLEIAPNIVIETVLHPTQDVYWGRRVGMSYGYTKLDGNNSPLWEVWWTVIGPDEYKILSSKNLVDNP